MTSRIVHVEGPFSHVSIGDYLRRLLPHINSPYASFYHSRINSGLFNLEGRFMIHVVAVTDIGEK
jgi:hypothetical protein